MMNQWMCHNINVHDYAPYKNNPNPKSLFRPFTIHTYSITYLQILPYKYDLYNIKRVSKKNSYSPFWVLTIPIPINYKLGYKGYFSHNAATRFAASWCFAVSSGF